METTKESNPKQDPVLAETSNLIKDPDDWASGEDPMTGAQASYLKTLSEEAHQEFDASLSKADASKRIDELRQSTGKNPGTSGS